MSSATGYDPANVNAFLYSNESSPDEEGGAGASPSLTKRQMELSRLWAYYRCTNYDNRTTDWNGGMHTDHVEHDAIATQGYVPPGFVDKGRQMLPLKFRRPTAPYYLARIVVERFTGLLFGEKRRPKITVEGDPDTTSYIEGVIEAGRLWPAMIKARNYGGGMGSVAMGFSLVNGVPLFETFDARWCTPIFADRQRLTLRSLEIRYVFTEPALGPEGEWVDAPFWYRRVISAQADTVWDRVPIEGNEEPKWKALPHRRVRHGLGVCPAIWIQNTSNDETLDGDSDCLGIYDKIETYDALISQANKGTVSNADPTLLIVSDSDLPYDLKKGSDNAIQLEKGASATYLELAGMGPKAARELADHIRERAFEVAACVPDNAIEGPQQTATEVVTRLSRMLERADVFREQYGEQGVKRILEIALLVCRHATTAQPVIYRGEDGEVRRELVRGEVRLPPRAVEQDDGTTVYEERRLGSSTYIKLQWPKYLEPTLDDAQKAVDVAQKALDAGLIDKQVAMEWLAQFLPLGNIRALLAKIKKAEDDKAAADAAAFGAAGGGGGAW